MADEQHEPEAVPSGPTARVADSYGANPNEHKPSQDPWVADEADDKQAETGGVVPTREEESSPGSSSSTSETDSGSSSSKTGQGSTPARTAVSPSTPAPKGSSTARSTGTQSKGPSGRASK